MCSCLNNANNAFLLKQVYILGDVGIEEELDLIGVPHFGGPKVCLACVSLVCFRWSHGNKLFGMKCHILNILTSFVMNSDSFQLQGLK